MNIRVGAAITLIVFASISFCPPALAIDPPTLYPGAAPGATHVLNQTALIGNVDDSAWFTHNIPFLDCPDTQIQQVYYYRWQTYKEHLLYTGPEYGWLSNEFLQPVSYGAPIGGVVDFFGFFFFFV